MHNSLLSCYFFMAECFQEHLKARDHRAAEPVYSLLWLLPQIFEVTVKVTRCWRLSMEERNLFKCEINLKIPSMLLAISLTGPKCLIVT